MEPDKKEWHIKKNWPDEYRHLLENCYPSLRHSDYSIEYEIRSYSNPAEIESILHNAPQNLSLEEFYILAQTYEPGSDEFNELFETAVRMYPSDPAANLNAANSAILRKDYSRALRYLDNAGDLPEAHFARGAVYIFKEDYEAARPHLDQAMKAGIGAAETALQEISKNRFVYKMQNK
jgi:tetratricopeptide (TPR) repeat protein